MLSLVLILGMLLFSSVANAQNTFLADAKIQVKNTIIANNVTPILICSTACALYSVDSFNNGTTLAYIKLYNAKAVADVTCGSGTPLDRKMIPFGTGSSGGGFNLSNINGDAYGVGIVMCVTTGIQDTDTGAPAANTYLVGLHFKPQAR